MAEARQRAIQLTLDGFWTRLRYSAGSATLGVSPSLLEICEYRVERLSKASGNSELTRKERACLRGASYAAVN